MGAAGRRVCRLGSQATRGAALLILMLWTVGRLASDRTLVTQVLAWTPTVVVVCVVAALLAGSWALLVLARGSQARPDVLHRKRLPRLRWVAAVWWLGACIYGMAYEHRMFSTPGPAVKSPGSLRLVFWNLGGTPSKGWLEAAHAMSGDVLVVAGGGGWNAVQEFLDWRDERQASNFNVLMFNVSSASPVLEYAGTTLGVEAGMGLDPRATDGVRKSRDPGRAMYFMLETRGTGLEGLGRPLVVWVVDLPSDLSLHRMKVAEEAMETMRRWKGRPRVRNADGAYVAGESREGFPGADVIVGDFNIPGGSASMTRFGADLRDAYREAGSGYAATFPRGMPLWRLDQVLVGDDLRAVSYQTRDMATGTHLLQMADLVIPRREPPVP